MNSKRTFSDEEIENINILKELKKRDLEDINKTKSFFNKADNYERAAYNWLLYYYRLPKYFAKFDDKVIGKGDIERQIDVTVYKSPNYDGPYILVEAKRWSSNNVQLNHIDAMLGKMEYLNIDMGMYISRKFSKNAKKWAKLSNIIPIEMVFPEADKLNWREIIRQYFSLDYFSHPKMANALRNYANYRKGVLTPDVIWDIIEKLEGLSYEEWLAWFRDVLQFSFYKTRQVLMFIAKNYYDSGWRYNAILLLEGSITKEELEKLLQSERDPETIDLINSLIFPPGVN